MSIYIIGMGTGHSGTLTADALEALKSADTLIGAARLLENLPDGCSPDRHAATAAKDIIDIIESKLNNDSICSLCVLMSGDTGFYSGTAKLLQALEGREVMVLPGVSSVSYFAARLKRTWQDWKLVSAHGKEIDATSIVRDHGETFFLTGGMLTVPCICRQLVKAGLGHITVTVGENLGGPEERISLGTAEEFTQMETGVLAVMLADNPAPRKTVSCGLSDEEFIRGDVPMTKREVRSVILSKLRLCRTNILYDVGAGTGTVSVEAALLLGGGHVYAFERSGDGCRLIGENARRHHAGNLTVVRGAAPDAFAGYPAPDAVFIGGSGGRLKGILETVLSMNPGVRLVVSAVTLETLAEAAQLFARLPIKNTEIVQISVSRADRLGAYHLMTAQNPVFIISGEGAGERG